MGLVDLNTAEIESFIFIFIRVGAMFLFVPILGSRQIPIQIKVGLSLLIAITIFPIVKPTVAVGEMRGVFELAIYMFSEITIGFAIGFAARLFFMTVQLAGTVVDFQMGFGVVNVIDPQTESNVSITAQFQNILAILIFLAVDAHHILIQAVTQSFFMINTRELHFDTFTPELILTLFISAFTVAIKLAGPIMAILFFIAVGLGLVARTVPQMNVFIVGFPLQIGAGLLMLGVSMEFFNIVLQNELELLPERLVGLMQSF
ncbi:MAG: flagellar biosynthetic protein FliR [Candidatus Nitrohelix vancouverensis]|uniref:Flagellar biosynthetic protein FliR n=1 Tax=Candidatus Nitrohelix vancouverensis TaxID=2705534 RepID=A0A7T0G3N7_9BACT|nr:MAG: flagellar biosynthetic protein FliR [Candidatus Nitrohelix vancouverensis]